MRFIAIFNRDGGTFRTMDLDGFATKAESLFSEHGHSLECRIVEGRDLIGALEAAASDPLADALLVGGGDGTISAAAATCLKAGRPLAVLPAGTMNLFARSLGLPLALDAALEALAGGTVRHVDIATANGRPFVHQYAVGMHSRLVTIRDGLPYRGRLGKMAASTRAMVEALSRPLRFEVEISTRAGTQLRQAMAIAVSNNPLNEGHVPYAEQVDRGVLGVYTVNPMPLLETVRLVVGVMMGRWKGHPRVSEQEVRQVTLRFKRRKKSAKAVIDGELIPLADQVDLRILPGALQVVVPAEVTVEAA